MLAAPAGAAALWLAARRGRASVAVLLGSGGRALVTRTLVGCLAISVGVHVVIYLLNAMLPLHVVGLGGSKTQVGLLFSRDDGVSMVLRPLVGGWVDRLGARAVMLPGVAVLALPPRWCCRWRRRPARSSPSWRASASATG